MANAYIESFNVPLRDEYLNEHWFVNIAHARWVIERWGIEYNTERPHSALGSRSPGTLQPTVRRLPCGRTRKKKPLRYL